MTTHPSLFHRDCGILLHPSSLPNGYGIGDFGPASHRWLQWLADTGQNLWQILPLNPVGYGESPYQGLSAFAASPLFLSPEALFEAGLLSRAELEGLRLPCADRVDYEAVVASRSQLIRGLVQTFAGLPKDHELRRAYARFRVREADWLEDFALFAAIKEAQGGVAWTHWPEPLRDRQPEALRAAAADLESAVEGARLAQFFLRHQWDAVRRRAADLGIRIVGDLPIFVAHDSADVWCRRELFRLNPDGSPSVVAGVPPDYFSKTGQLWGNPLYQWEAHAAEDYAWWRARLRQTLTWVDVVRIDHFRGFEAFWEVPGGAETAADGHWVQAPGAEVFSRFEADHGRPLPVIAEDLGVITEAVTKLRDDFGLPGIRILQFAFGTDPMKDTFVPESYTSNCVAYTGTHDNDTTMGWFHSEAGGSSTRSAEEIEAECAAALAYFGGDGGSIHEDFIKSLYQSDCGAALVPLQDLLGLGSEARMNTPGVASGSWRWRLPHRDALERRSEFLGSLTRSAGRGLYAPQSAPVPPSVSIAS